MSVTVFIRYQLDPFKRAQFEEYSRRWLSIIPRCGGDLRSINWPRPSRSHRVDHHGLIVVSFRATPSETRGSRGIA